MKALKKNMIVPFAATLFLLFLYGCDPFVRDDTWVINRTEHKITVEVSKHENLGIDGYYSDVWHFRNSMRILNVLPGDSVFAGSAYDYGWAPSVFAKNDTILVVFNDTLVLALISPGDHSKFGDMAGIQKKMNPEWELTLWYITDRHYRGALDYGYIRPSP